MSNTVLLHLIFGLCAKQLVTSQLLVTSLMRRGICILECLNANSTTHLHLRANSTEFAFKSICQLESDNHVWDRIQRGLPPGQLSFLLRAGSDTLPTPLNLKRWNLRVDSKYHLCGSSTPTVFHILNGCPVALDQARYTWRHDSVLWRLDKAIRSHMLEGDHLYSDISGLRAHENPQSTVPHDLTITTARPDMVYI